jgi:H/ACA ribonucleoprotein complex subunit 4
MVTGVLPLALEEATKTIQVFLLTGKEYVCLMALHGDVPENKIRNTFKEFTGSIYQRPPIRAAVKRELRIRKIYAYNDIEINGRLVLFRVACQAGTYIRKLVYDIGEVLQVGAHMRELRRTRAGAFTEDGITTMYDLLELANMKGDEKEVLVRRLIRPMESAFEHVPKIVIRDSAVNAICHGAELAVPGIVRATEGIRAKNAVAIFTLKGELVALANALISTEEMVKNEKGLAAKTARVIMPPDTYPRMWKGQTPTTPQPLTVQG